MARNLMDRETGSGKFEGEVKLTRRLHEMDEDDEIGDAESASGNHRLYLRLSDSDFDPGETIGPTRAAILTENADGFVFGRYFESDDAAQAAWDKLVEQEESEFTGDDDDFDDDDVDDDDDLMH
jgi:hypothetical protein